MPTLVLRLSRALALLTCFAGLLAPRLAADSADAVSASSRQDYRIAARDLIQFQMFEEPDVAVVQRVTASGEIRLPMIGTVLVKDMTLREAEALLAKLYVDGGFYVSPQVILSVQQYDERSVSVLGQVNRPEAIPFPLEQKSISLARAITMAGGLTRIARSDSIQVTRRGAAGEDERFVINLEAALSNKGTAKGADFELLPGDVVFIPERTF